MTRNLKIFSVCAMVSFIVGMLFVIFITQSRIKLEQTEENLKTIDKNLEQLERTIKQFPAEEGKDKG